jgi:hypothetical protein
MIKLAGDQRVTDSPHEDGCSDVEIEVGIEIATGGVNGGVDEIERGLVAGFRIGVGIGSGSGRRCGIESCESPSGIDDEAILLQINIGY